MAAPKFKFSTIHGSVSICVSVSLGLYERSVVRSGCGSVKFGGHAVALHFCVAQQASPGRQLRVNYVHSTITGGRALYMEANDIMRST